MSGTGQVYKTKGGNTPLVSVILLLHNKSAYSRRCFDGLLGTPYRPFEIIAVDNGSSDDTAKMLDEYQQSFSAVGINLKRLSFEENLGAITGRNKALELVAGKFVVFMDNDVTPRTSTWMRRLVEYLQAHSGVGVVAPKMIYPSDPHLIQCAGCDVSPTGRVWFRGRGEACQAAEFNSERECQALISACWMMPAAVIEQLGPLDTGFSPVQFEDIDYCYRLREIGLKAMFFPEVEMYHFENVTTGRTGNLNYKYLTVKNGMLFKEKWQHMFSLENGPLDADLKWREDIPGVSLEEIGQLEKTP